MYAGCAKEMVNADRPSQERRPCRNKNPEVEHKTSDPETSGSYNAHKRRASVVMEEEEEEAEYERQHLRSRSLPANYMSVDNSTRRDSASLSKRFRTLWNKKNKTDENVFAA